MHPKTLKQIDMLAREMPPELYKINGGHREIDHKSRMKKAYKRRGKVGIIDYCSQYIKEDMMPQFVAFVNANFR